MSCPICNRKAANCDCTDAERKMCSDNEELSEHLEATDSVVETLGKAVLELACAVEKLSDVSPQARESVWFNLHRLRKMLEDFKDEQA